MALRRVHVSGGNKCREKDLIRYSNGSITGSHCRSKHKTQVFHLLANELLKTSDTCCSTNVDLEILAWGLYGTCAGLYVLATLVSWEYQNSLSKDMDAEKFQQKLMTGNEL